MYLQGNVRMKYRSGIWHESNLEAERGSCFKDWLNVLQGAYYKTRTNADDDDNGDNDDDKDNSIPFYLSTDLTPQSPIIKLGTSFIVLGMYYSAEVMKIWIYTSTPHTPSWRSA
jgi:hypothetical protein